jgi:hypothetical protein
MPTTETLEGHVVDIACLRKYPQDELADRAREHTTSCSLMGHCAESGYALVGDDGRPVLLEPQATPRVMAALRESDREAGVRLRARREMRDGEMETVAVEEL